MTTPRLVSHNRTTPLQDAIQANCHGPMTARDLADSELNLVRFFKILLEINGEHQIVDTSKMTSYPRAL